MAISGASGSGIDSAFRAQAHRSDLSVFPSEAPRLNLIRSQESISASFIPTGKVAAIPNTAICWSPDTFNVLPVSRDEG